MTTYFHCINVDCPMDEPVTVHGCLRGEDRVLCLACGEPMDEVDYRDLESEPLTHGVNIR